MSDWRIILDALTKEPRELDIVMMGGTFRSGTTSTVQIRCIMPADAEQIAVYNEAVVITRNGDPFFNGKVRKVPKSQSGESESQTYIIEDAWADWERNTYQENWETHTGTILTPRVYLGIDSDGDPLTLGQQISKVLEFAGGITVGTIPTGMALWPTEVFGMSCAEVIRTSLRFHPDWIPWINHTTTPPTFNVTPVASATALSIALGNYTDLQITDVSDRLPTGVRIIFQTVDEFNSAGAEDPEDLTIERVVNVDKWPEASAESGPGILTTVVDLQGARAVVQKQQVQTRPLPTDNTTLRAWLKKQYPAFRGMPDAAFSVRTANITLVEPDVADVRPAALNPEKGPLEARDMDDCPRQLVSGALPEWARKRTGQVRLEWDISPTATATAAQRKIIEGMPKGDTVTGTNATTKIYRGLSNWAAAETAPTGIAALYYNTIHGGCRFEGSIGFLATDVAPPWHGKKLNVTGGHADWATMNAPIHAVQWDAQTDQVSVDFGPTPDYAFQDYLEYLRLLNNRKPCWITGNERTEKEIGEISTTSAYQDAVGPFDTPFTAPEMGPVFTTPFHLYVTQDGADWKWAVSSKRSSVRDGHNGDAFDLSTAGFDTFTTFAATSYIYLTAAVSSLALSSWDIIASTTELDEIEMSGTNQSVARLYIGKVSLAGDPAVGEATQACFTPQKTTHGFLNGVIVKVFTATPASL